jgi:hypothetical protein
VISNLLFDESKPYSKISAYPAAADVYSHNVYLRADTATIKEELSTFIWKEHCRTVVRITDSELEEFKLTHKFPHPRQIQFVSDCYAYDWMLLVDLLWGDDISNPNHIEYIPLDLSTMLSFNDINPDVDREEFSDINDDDPFISTIKGLVPENTKSLKHNSLWDAYIISKCVKKLMRKKIK